ncbi:MAG: hypothetical protein N0E48_27125, partial [Candidatus Thiodiazotropha endolucinida]|nr:hypothetical protein [Candidatus Thiodiazotropha endolucinida]
MSDRCHGQSITIRITVIGEYVNGDWGIFVSAYRIVSGDRCVIHGTHGHSNGRGIGATIAIVDGVGEGIGTIEIRIWRIDRVATYWIDGNCAIRTLSHSGDRQHITVWVAVIGEYVNGDWGIFVGAYRIVGGDWCVI